MITKICAGIGLVLVAYTVVMSAAVMAWPHLALTMNGLVPALGGAAFLVVPAVAVLLGRK